MPATPDIEVLGDEAAERKEYGDVVLTFAGLVDREQLDPLAAAQAVVDDDARSAAHGLKDVHVEAGDVPADVQRAVEEVATFITEFVDGMVRWAREAPKGDGG